MTSVLLSPADTNLAVHLERLEARVLTWPQLKFGEPEDLSTLHQAIADLFGYDWLVLKNDRAAEYFLHSFKTLSLPDTLDQLRVLAITAAAVEQLADSQIHVDLALDHSSRLYSAIEAYFGSHEAIAGLNFLIPCAGIARESFETQLENAGARVDAVVTYRTTTEKQKLSQLKALLVGGGISFVAFTCASAVEELAELFDCDDLSQLLTETKVACLDSDSRDAAIRVGLPVTVAPDEPSIASLANLIVNASP